MWPRGTERKREREREREREDQTREREREREREKYRFFLQRTWRGDIVQTGTSAGATVDCRLTVKQSVEGYTRLALERTTAQQLTTVVRGKQSRDRGVRSQG